MTSHTVGVGQSDRSPDPIRIVQNSDLHLRRFLDREVRLTQTVRELKPNTIVFTGEIIDRAENLALLELFLAALGPTPRVAVLGNWEYWSTVDLQRLRKIGLNLTDLTHWVQQHFGLRAASASDALPADNAWATEWLESARRQVGEALHLPTPNR